MGIETLAIAGLAASVIGTGVSAYGQYRAGQSSAASAQMQGQAAAQQYQYQAAVADLNKQTALRNQGLAETNAAYVETSGARLQEDRARRIRATIGSQRAALASNNLIASDGSGADLQRDTAGLGGLAISEIRTNAGRQASGYRIQGYNAADEAAAATLRGDSYRSSAGNSLAAGDFAADSARTAGMWNAGSSLLGGATASFDRFADMRRSGIFMNNVPAVV